MSKPLFKTAGVGEEGEPWVIVLTTPLRGGAYLLCVNAAEHAVYALPYREFSWEQATFIGKIVAKIIGAVEAV